MSAPASASISSVWVRVVTGSRTIVVPLADSPARRMADFTCALATFDVQSMPWSAPPPMRTGGRQRSPRPRTVAPMRPSGSATRSIGRRESDSSPTSSVSHAKPATRPARRRMEVPELPQSSAPSARCSRARPPWSTMRPVLAALHAGAHGLDRSQRRRNVGAVREPADDGGAFGQRSQQHGPVRDRLLAGGPHDAPAGHPAEHDEDARCAHERCSARQRYPCPSTAAAKAAASAPSTTRIRTPRGPSAEWAISMS